MSNTILEYSLILVFLAVQYRITRLVLAASGRPVVRYAILAFDAAALASYALTFQWVIVRSGLSPRLIMLLGAGALTYFMTASAVVAVHSLLLLLHRMLDADTAPARRRVLNLTGNALMAAPFAVMGYGALVQRTDFRVREVDVPIPGLSGDLENLRILQLSDTTSALS